MSKSKKTIRVCPDSELYPHARQRMMAARGALFTRVVGGMKDYHIIKEEPSQRDSFEYDHLLGFIRGEYKDMAELVDAVRNFIAHTLADRSRVGAVNYLSACMLLNSVVTEESVREMFSIVEPRKPSLLQRLRGVFQS